MKCDRWKKASIEAGRIAHQNQQVPDNKEGEQGPKPGRQA